MRAWVVRFVLALVAAGTALGAPTVVRSEPANGAVGVLGPDVTIVVTFSEGLKQNSWSLVPVEGAELPELVGDPKFDDPKTCRIQVRVKPGTKYGLGLNSARRHGFVSADGERPLEPFQLVFTTAGEAPPSDPNRIGIPAEAAGKAGIPFGAVGGPDEPGERALGGPGDLAWERVAEPRERAFTFEKPSDWLVDGGIVRFPPDAAGAVNATEAKLDITLRSDPAGTILARWVPDLFFIDATGSPAGPMFPPGSQMNGMISMPKMPAAVYLAKLVFPQCHPQARGAKILAAEPLPDLARKHADLARALGLPGGFSWDAAAITVQYEEGGIAFVERLVAVVEDWGQLGAGMWKSKETYLFRAPAAQFNAWLPIVQRIQGSVQLDRAWLVKELEAAAARGEQVAGTMRDVNRIADEIAAHRRATNETINQQMYETLTQ